MTTVRVTVSDEAALRFAAGLRILDMWPEVACIEVLLADRLRLAQALRLLRDTTSGEYIGNVCFAALAECGIEDPEEDHP